MKMKTLLSLTINDRIVINRFMAKQSINDDSIDQEKWNMTFSCRERGGIGWHRLTSESFYVLRIIYWYQNIYKLGSREWRPAIIIRALLEEARKS